MRIKAIATTIIAAGLLASVYHFQGQMTNNTPSEPGDAHHQYGHRGPMSQQEHMDWLAQELSLTDQQKTNVQAVFEQMRQQMQAAFGEAKTNADTQLQQILTPEQYQKMQAMWQQREHHWRQGHGGTGETNDMDGANETNNPPPTPQPGNP